MAQKELHKIIISRTDSIGDVMLTLPLCVWLREKYPNAELIFLGRTYTESIVSCFSCIDRFLNWDEIQNLPLSVKIDSMKADCIIHVFPRREIAVLAKKAKIPLRIGTAHRTFHFLNCNSRVNFSRKKSLLHEAQLNFELLRPLGLQSIPSLNEIQDQSSNFIGPNTILPTFLKDMNWDKTIVLHPKSQGSALEWPLENYVDLANLLVTEGYSVLLTGTEKEGALFRHLFQLGDSLIDSTGKLTLIELISVLSKTKALAACSTGPLHISAMLNIRSVGLYSMRKPIHPGRWKPLGVNSVSLVFDENCPTCAKGVVCQCLRKIPVNMIRNALLEL
jgi:ADP-heptose:LPS heptosyltransferase